MPAATLIASYLVTSFLAGLFGGLAMEGVMRLMTRTGWAKGDMIVALGSLFTRSRDHAFAAGAVLHVVSAVIFATLYALVLLAAGQTGLPNAFMLGLGIGIFHGMIVSLILVWIVAEHHPLEEFNEAGFAIGLSHFAGHVAYGAVVGLTIGLSPL